MEIVNIKTQTSEHKEAMKLIHLYAESEGADWYEVIRQSRKESHLFALMDQDQMQGCLCLIPLHKSLLAICLLKDVFYSCESCQKDIHVELQKRYPEYFVFLDWKCYAS